MGSKFSINFTHRDLPLIDIIRITEYVIQSINDDVNKNEIRSKCTNAITNYMKSHTNNNKPDLLEKEYQSSKNFLSQNNNIIFTRPDKGNSTVIIPKDDYYHKMSQLVSDKNTYKLLNKNMTTYYEDCGILRKRFKPTNGEYKNIQNHF
ncbi:hypothetical protein JTB14_032207 [Gonioctena quinquepunctata]|nr:hypothetical protein JTB14_032207 [Gonioctena quinquepunctata]